MTLQQIWQAALASRTPQDGPDAAFDLACLFEAAFGISRQQLPLQGTLEASPQNLKRFQQLCARWRTGEPLQYLLGQWEFWGLPFAVGPGVLIPRPDTETLVELGLSLLEGRESPAVMDLCAGSGAIAVSIAHSRPDSSVWAMELSQEAFPYLERNIRQNQVPVTPLLADVFTPPNQLPPLDLVLSNPPYIRQTELPGLQTQVQWEPVMALDGGADGLAFYRALPSIWQPKLKPGGWIAFEVGYDQADTVCALLEAAGFTRVDSRRDLAGIRRAVFGQRPQ